jgi:hypothetical protein
MTVELWYGRQPDNPAEQNILIDLNDFLRAQAEHFVVLSTFHAGRNEIDLLVLKQQAWFVAEIKHVWGKVIGGQEGHWECVQPDGSLKPLPSDNPFRQVRSHHHGLRDWLKDNFHMIRPSVLSNKPFDLEKFHPLQYIVLYPEIPRDSQIDIKEPYVQVVDLHKFRTALAMRTAKGSDFTVEELQAIPRLLKLTRWQLDPAQSSAVESTEPDAPRIQPGPIEPLPQLNVDNSSITKVFPANYRPPTVRMLVPREQNLAQSVFYITESPICVGREPGCDLVINHESVSRKHAEIRWDKDRWIVRDFASRNGVFVAYNGDPNTERRIERFNALKNGSIVRFGQVSFTFLLNESK